MRICLGPLHIELDSRSLSHRATFHIFQATRSTVLILGYSQVNVREERVLRTRTINNDLNPTWDQTFHFLVDSIDSQSLSKPPRFPQLYSLCLLQGSRWSAVSWAASSRQLGGFIGVAVLNS